MVSQANDTTPQHKNVFMALAAAQLEMEPVLKGAINPAFKGEGKPKGTAYADLSDVVEAVRGPLNKHGMAYFHQIIDGVLMRTSLVHGESETRIDCDVPLLVDRQNMQGMKSATTYAKRIGLESVTGVAPEDDDGNAAAAAAPKHQDAPRPNRKADTPPPVATKDADEGAIKEAVDCLNNADTIHAANAIWATLPTELKHNQSVIDAAKAAKSRNTPKDQAA